MSPAKEIKNVCIGLENMNFAYNYRYFLWHFILATIPHKKMDTYLPQEKTVLNFISYLLWKITE